MVRDCWSGRVGYALISGLAKVEPHAPDAGDFDLESLPRRVREGVARLRDRTVDAETLSKEPAAPPAVPDRPMKRVRSRA